MSAPASFPLVWPEGAPRHVGKRERTRPGGAAMSLPSVVFEIKESVRLFGVATGLPVSGLVISSNVTIDHLRPEDPGVAVYFEWDGAQRCVACDDYGTPEANLQAVLAILEDRRREVRSGALAVARVEFGAAGAAAGEA